jgi:charged multivesicular body protein 2A
LLKSCENQKKKKKKEIKPFLAERMEWLFGKKKTTKEIIREQQRMMRRSIRDIDREHLQLERQEKKTIGEIKKLARDGQTDSARTMAKNLVRTRQQMKKLTQMKAELQSVSMRIQTLQSQQAVAEAMKGCTRAMIRMNKQVDVAGMQRMMMEFERQSEMLEMKDEMIEDAMDDMMDVDEEAESEDIVNQVLDEIGISLSAQLVDAPAQQATFGSTQRVDSGAASVPEQRLAEPIGASSSSSVPSSAPAPSPTSGAAAPPAAATTATTATTTQSAADLDLQARLDALKNF